ncbi:hypothetical protein HOG98_04785 [bacterium]|jgi:hypothetical protein|nr:hypothetical protein [bacterium]
MTIKEKYDDKQKKLGFSTLLIISLISILSISLAGTVKLMQLHVQYSTKKFNAYKTDLKTKSVIHLIPALLDANAFSAALYEDILPLNQISSMKEQYYSSLNNILTIDNSVIFSGIIHLSPTQFIALSTNQHSEISKSFGKTYRSMYLGIINSESSPSNNSKKIISIQKI